MRPGNLKAVFFISLFVLNFYDLNSQEKVNLQDLQPSFEEESEIQGSENNVETSKIKTKKKKSIDTNETVVKLRALDKITAKTSDINIVIGNKKRFGYLEILPKRCAKSKENRGDGVTAYLQVKDLSDNKDDKVFVFNGWTFSSSPSIQVFDHPVYDLWILKCY